LPPNHIINTVSITNVSKEIIQTMDKRTDEDILLEAYRHYFKLAKAKNFGGKKRATSKNSEILYKVDKILLFFNKPSATAPENKKLMSQAKNVYQEYVSFKLSNEKFVTQSLERKMDALISQMANYESERISYFRSHEPGGDRINVEAIFEVDGNVRQLMFSPIEIILKNALSDRRFTIVSKVDQKVYITNSGFKYHRLNCPYCKRFKLKEVSFAMIENAGYTPCRCIGTTDKVHINREHMSDADKVTLAKRTITAFIDESIRTTPLSRMDSKRNERQASYSYIICKGCLGKESEITIENTLSTNACLANEAKDTTYSAIEAINAVLMKIAFNYKFDGDVIIYTDNMGAVEKWHKKDSNIYMASLFESVKVCYIPREQNTKADMVGRERTFTDIPTDFLEELIESRNDYKLQVIQKDNELSRLHEELEFVKNYFPNPQYNIPNLIEELRLLAEEREV
jgi:hypothetical protein